MGLVVFASGIVDEWPGRCWSGRPSVLPLVLPVWWVWGVEVGVAGGGGWVVGTLLGPEGSGGPCLCGGWLVASVPPFVCPVAWLVVGGGWWGCCLRSA